MVCSMESPKCTVSGLQAVQNSAARIVAQEMLRDHDSMSQAFIRLHWLPVDKRIEYKPLLYTYKALHDLAPGYLCELVVSCRVLRSAQLNLLMVPPGKPGKYGSRSFAIVKSGHNKSFKYCQLVSRGESSQHPTS